MDISRKQTLELHGSLTQRHQFVWFVEIGTVRDSVPQHLVQHRH